MKYQTILSMLLMVSAFVSARMIPRASTSTDTPLSISVDAPSTGSIETAPTSSVSIMPLPSGSACPTVIMTVTITHHVDHNGTYSRTHTRSGSSMHPHNGTHSLTHNGTSPHHHHSSTIASGSMAVTPLTGEEASTGMPFVAVPTAFVTITNLPGIPFALKPSQVTGTVSIMTIGPMVGQFGVPTPAVLSLTSQPTAVSNGYY